MPTCASVTDVCCTYSVGRTIRNGAAGTARKNDGDVEVVVVLEFNRSTVSPPHGEAGIHLAALPVCRVLFVFVSMLVYEQGTHKGQEWTIVWWGNHSLIGARRRGLQAVESSQPSFAVQVGAVWWVLTCAVHAADGLLHETWLIAGWRPAEEGHD